MISSESNAQIKEIIKLQKSVRERRKKRIFIVEGIKLVEEAISHGKLQKVYISESAMENRDMGWERALDGYPFEVTADSVFRLITGTVTPQGVLGLVQMPEYEFGAMVQDRRRCFLLLDDLRDPGNLGTIMRTAEGAGMSGVILGRGCVDLFNPKVVRATMGAIFRVPFCYVEDLADVIRQLKNGGIPVYGTMVQGSIVYDEADYRCGAAIVIGNEANGISEKVAAELSAGVRIPMAGSLESLNAAVSAAVLMYEVSRQKRHSREQ